MATLPCSHQTVAVRGDGSDLQVIRTREKSYRDADLLSFLRRLTTVRLHESDQVLEYSGFPLEGFVCLMVGLDRPPELSDTVYCDGTMRNRIVAQTFVGALSSCFYPAESVIAALVRFILIFVYIAGIQNSSSLPFQPSPIKSKLMCSCA